MSRALDSLFAQAAYAKDLIRDAVKWGHLTEENAADAHSALSRMILALQGGQRPAAIHTGPLSEFFRWPCTASPCPKCGGRKLGGIVWCPETPASPERVKHKCSCGYGIYTKTLDNSPSADLLSWGDDNTGTQSEDAP